MHFKRVTVYIVSVEGLDYNLVIFRYTFYHILPSLHENSTFIFLPCYKINKRASFMESHLG